MKELKIKDCEYPQKIFVQEEFGFDGEKELKSRIDYKKLRNGDFAVYVLAEVKNKRTEIVIE